MVDERRLMQKLEEEAAVFRNNMEAKRYNQAKHNYDKAVAVAVFNELEEEKMEYLFGKREKRGEVVKAGLFAEEMVSKAYYECCVKRDSGRGACLLCK